jgi:putative addiction module killer protein
MKERAYYIHRVPEFRDWFGEQTEKARVQIDDRLSKIQDEGYFGNHKSVSDDDEILELKWKNGRRIYFAHIPERKILILLGGNKNGQDKDIRKAKNLYKKYTT